MLLALLRLGTTGLRCHVGPRCREGLSALVRGLSVVNRAGVTWGQTGMGRGTQQGYRARAALQRCRLLREVVQGREGQSSVGGIVETLGLASAFACSPWTLPKSARPRCWAAAAREVLPAPMSPCMSPHGQELSPTFRAMR